MIWELEALHSVKDKMIKRIPEGVYYIGMERTMSKDVLHLLVYIYIYMYKVYLKRKTILQLCYCSDFS